MSYLTDFNEPKLHKHLINNKNDKAICLFHEENTSSSMISVWQAVSVNLLRENPEKLQRFYSRVKFPNIFIFENENDFLQYAFKNFAVIRELFSGYMLNKFIWTSKRETNSTHKITVKSLHDFEFYTRAYYFTTNSGVSRENMDKDIIENFRKTFLAEPADINVEFLKTC